MTEFKKVPLNKRSLPSRKLVHGVGVNDSWYLVNPKVNGKQIMCPAYVKWQSMLLRCYSAKQHLRNPTYIGCSVCDEWLTFSNFAKWHEENKVDGYDLDKDIKFKGNKVYGPENCLLVPSAINSLLTDNAASRGEYPIGVCFNKRVGKFSARIRIDGKRKHLGYFTATDSAHQAYKIAKNSEIKRKAKQHPELEKYLINHLFKI